MLKPETRNEVILSTAYLPPIQYFTKFIGNNKIVFDYHETFLKQSYRNRCTIFGANGLHDLSIPVIKPNGNRTQTKDIQLEHTTNWQQVHWKALVSAYMQSPFFEILEDEFKPYFTKKVKYLVDWNEQLLHQVAKSLDMALHFSLTDDYITAHEEEYDFRNCISPKPRLQKPDNTFVPKVYYQVFTERFGFQPNLSIIDLLFNAGPETVSVCLQSIRN